MDRRELLEIQRDDLRALLAEDYPFEDYRRSGTALVPKHMVWRPGMKFRLSATLLLIESELQELRK